VESPLPSAAVDREPLLEKIQMKRIALLLAPVILALPLSACSSDPNNVSYKAITGNLSPEMSGLSQRPVDRDTDLAVTNNQNLRMFNDDLGRVFYTNHASTLSPYPVTNLSGSPE